MHFLNTIDYMIKDILENNQDVKATTYKLAALREHFAGCFTSDGAFDLERFKDMLRDEVDLSVLSAR